jgi:hypothetical protein
MRRKIVVVDDDKFTANDGTEYFLSTYNSINFHSTYIKHNIYQQDTQAHS